MESITPNFCSSHLKKQADYICETCNLLFCTSCYFTHRKTNENHIIYNFKEFAVSKLSEIKNCINSHDSEKIPHCETEKLKIAEITGKILKQIEILRENLLTATQNFEKKFISHNTLIFEDSDFKIELDKMSELEEKGEYYQLFCKINDLQKSGKISEIKNSPKIPYEILKDQILDNILEFSNKTHEICTEHIPTKIIPVTEKVESKKNIENESPKEFFTSPDLPPENTEKPNELLPLKKLIQENNEKNQEEDKTSPTLENYQKYVPLFDQYKKEDIAKFDMQSEEELSENLTKTDLTQYRMICIDSPIGGSDSIIQSLSIIIPAYSNITAFYLGIFTTKKK